MEEKHCYCVVFIYCMLMYHLVQSFYCRSNSILTNCNMLKCMDINKLHMFFGINMYSIELLDHRNKYINTI